MLNKKEPIVNSFYPYQNIQYYLISRQDVPLF